MEDEQRPDEEKELPDEEKELSAEDILNANDTEIERLTVPEWGGFVYVRNLTALDKERYVKSVRQVVGKGNKRTTEMILEKSGAKLVQMTLCNKHGVLLFENKPEIIARLAQKSSKAMQRVIDASSRLNGLNEEAEEEAKNDSAATTETNSDSSTVSPVH